MNWDDLSDEPSLDEILAWAGDQPWAGRWPACRQDAGLARRGGRLDPHADGRAPNCRGLTEWPALDRARADGPRLHGPVPRLREAAHVAGRSRRPGGSRSPKHAVEGGAPRPRRSCETSGATWRPARRSPGWSASTAARRSCWRSPTRPTKSSRSPGWSSNRLLYLFALADTRGRTTAEMARPEENLHLWKLVAEENGCFDRPYPFANDQARFLFYRGALSEPALRPARGLPLHGHDDVGPARLGQGHLAGDEPPRAAGRLARRRAWRTRRRADRRPGRGGPGRPGSAAGSTCRAGRSFAFNATNTAAPDPASDGSTCSPTTGPGSRSSTSNRRCR